jgi:hypothetical protein
MQTFQEVASGLDTFGEFATIFILENTTYVWSIHSGVGTGGLQCPFQPVIKDGSFARHSALVCVCVCVCVCARDDELRRVQKTYTAESTRAWQKTKQNKIKTQRQQQQQQQQGEGSFGKRNR